MVEAVPEEDGNADMDAFIPMSTIEFTLPDATAPSSDIPGILLMLPLKEHEEPRLSLRYLLCPDA